MPHLHIEYSKGVSDTVDIAELCASVHKVMLADRVFPTAGIRVRAFCADHAIVADGLPENNFVAMTLSVGAGRSTEVLHAAGQKIFSAAQDTLQPLLSTTHFSLSLEIREINPDLSWKDTPIHARLSATEKKN